MSFRNSVTIVASPRPRVGKTLLARLLTGFHGAESRAVRAFDVNVGKNTLAQFAPAQTVQSDLASTAGQMALFDRLVAADDVAKVVDLGQASFEAFFALAAQLDFAGEAHRRGIAPAILFIGTPDATSVEAYRQLRASFPSAILTPVHNELLGAMPHQAKYPASGSGSAIVRLPVLAAALRKYVETPPFAFSDDGLDAATHIPSEARDELQRWLRRVYLEFRDLDLRILMADLQSSLRGS
ncbi:MAG: hypothetical protein Q8M26_05055 [Pseudolabrys sp.]|nr:hypothetical protein [Pseudolabrys sp.]